MSLTEQINAALDRADAINKRAVDAAGNPRKLTDEEQRSYDEAIEVSDTLQTTLDRQNDLVSKRSRAVVRHGDEEGGGTTDLDGVADEEKRKSGGGAGGVRIEVREKDTYRPDGEHSWFVDVRNWKKTQSPELRERLFNFTTFEVNEKRHRFAEMRTYSGTAGEGGNLIAPAYLQAELIKLRKKASPLRSLVRRLPHPGTKTIYVPKMLTSTAVARYAMNATLTETAMTDDQIAVTSYRAGGLATIPNELLDFSFPGIDQIVLEDLAIELNLLVEYWMLEGTGTNMPYGIKNTVGVNAVTFTAGTATAAGYYAKVMAAQSAVATNHYGMATHILQNPRRWFWLRGQVDGDSRPFIGAEFPMNATGETSQGVEGVVGVYGGLVSALDNVISITNGAGTDEDYSIVGDPSENWLMEGAVMLDASDGVAFKNDQTVFRARQDVMFTAGRYPKSQAVISGTGMNDVL